MSDHELTKELNETGTEPLLPIERKLIAWSIGLGLGLLIVLAVINRML